jgi:tRNA A-37 threonylcarbamoyl transferase component Bud32
MSTPSQFIKNGNLYPFDAPNSWWEAGPTEDQELPPPAVSQAHSAARGVIKALQERKGLIPSLDIVAEDTRAEIVQEIAAIIEVGMKNPLDAQQPTNSRADMAEKIYGKSVEKVIDQLRKSVYKEIGNLLWAQSKGAIVPPDLTVNNVKIPLIPEV